MPDVDPATDAPPSIPRQRWRLVLARADGAPTLAGRELVDAWEAAVESSALPLFRPAGRVRARVAFGAPIGPKLIAEQELADIVLTEFVPTWRVREGLEGRCPEGWRLVDLYDIWLGSPALAGQVAGADYRIELEAGDQGPEAGALDATTIVAAANRLLDAHALPRERIKAGSLVTYDLRPLLADIALVDPGPPVIVRTRTRFHPVLGTGRPEEVVAALADEVGRPLVARSTVRERLILADEEI